MTDKLDQRAPLDQLNRAARRQVSVSDDIHNGKYNVPPFSFDPVPVDDDVMTVREAKEHLARERERRKAEYEDHLRELANVSSKLRDDLEAEYGLRGHPKADRVWDMAWRYGHSSGYQEVASWYDLLAELVK